MSLSRPAGTCRWAQDVMQVNPVMLRQRQTVQQAIENFISQQLDTLLVVKEADLSRFMKLAGRVCIKDILHLILPSLLRKDMKEFHDALAIPVDDVVIAHPKTMTPWAGIVDVVTAMLADYTQVIGIEQDEKLVGQVNSGSILKLVLDTASAGSAIGDNYSSYFSQLCVNDLMAGYVICLEPDDDIARAICLFLATAIRYIPVLDKQARLVGIVSQQDILDYVASLMDPVSVSVFENKDSILDRPVSTLLHKEAQVVFGKAELSCAAKLLADQSCDCLAVMDSQNKFCGILSHSEIFNWIVRHPQIFSS
ncbi:MAG: CBS domain-containing protein [Sedimentisphaerales bacterium]|nr:CBS domain-containing protein [Sedimentisphaerales bacterium]